MLSNSLLTTESQLKLNILIRVLIKNAPLIQENSRSRVMKKLTLVTVTNKRNSSRNSHYQLLLMPVVGHHTNQVSSLVAVLH